MTSPAASTAMSHAAIATNGPPQSPQPRKPKPFWRWLAWGFGAVVLLPLLVLAAWVLSNLQDAPPLPRPPELAPAVSNLPAATNSAYALMGLGAAADRDPAVAGRALFEAERAFFALPVAQRDEPARLAAFQKAQQEATGTLLAPWSGAPLVCESQRHGCAATWLTQLPALAQQLKPHVLLGRRCEELLDGNFAFEEVPLVPTSLATPLASHVLRANHCATWFHAHAVLAWSQGQPDAALKQLQRADKLNRTLLAGSHSLISQMVVLNMNRRMFDTVSVLAVRDAALAPRLMPLAAALPDTVAAIKRWMAFESNYGRVAFSEAFTHCASNPAYELNAVDDWRARLSTWWDVFSCRHQIGLQPQRTLQLFDAFWAGRMGSLEGGLLAAIATQTQRSKLQAAQSQWQRLSWQNTAGAMLVDIAEPAYDGYLLRHADVELHRQTVALVVAAAAVPAGQRTSWAQQQNLSPELRERLTWTNDGHTLQVKTWQGTHGPGSRNKSEETIQIAWPQ